MLYYIDPDIKKLQIQLLELKIKNQQLLFEKITKELIK